MTQSKHTPGPWDLLDGDNGYEITSGNIIIAQVTDEPCATQEDANARLIAAAPDLLEALEMADAALSGANMDMKAVERKTRAAIAKAKGGVE